MENTNNAMADTASSRTADRNVRIDFWLAWGAITLAILVRVLFLADKPFWRDEAWVALSIDDPIRAAADGRAAPLGFLWISHLLSGLPRLPPEISYRLVPLFGGIALVPLIGRFARTLGASRRVGVTVMWLAAGLQPLVYYSRELKSYGLDALVAVLVPLLALAAFGDATDSTSTRDSLAGATDTTDARNSLPDATDTTRARDSLAGASDTTGIRDSTATRQARVAFLAVVVLVPWLTFGGIFAAVAVFAWGWLVWWRQSDRDHRRAWMLCSAAFLASFAAVYALALGNQAGDRWMHAYWAPVLARDDRMALPLRFVMAMVDYFANSLNYLFPRAEKAVVAVSILGALTWPRPHRAFLIFLYLGSAAICAAAAVSDHYLLVAGRLLLISAPIPLLWSANALHSVGRLAGPRAGGLLAVAIAMGFALASSAQSIRHRTGPTRTDGANFFRYDVRQNVDRILDEGQESVPDGRAVLISRRTTYMFKFYNHDRWKGVRPCHREDGRCDDHAEHWIKRLKDRGWILMTDEETTFFSRLLDAAGARHRERASTGSVRLWEVEKTGETSQIGNDRTANESRRHQTSRRTARP